MVLTRLTKSAVLASACVLLVAPIGCDNPRSRSEHTSKHIVMVDDANFDEVVLQSDKPVLVDCWAVWCGPCKALAPTINELAETYQGQAVIAKLNIDKARTIATRYQITSIPTVLVIHKGQEVDRLVGVQPKGNYIGKLRRLLK